MGKKILIVEDESVTVMLYREILQESGYIIAGTASSGEEAIRLAFEKKPDIIIMDITLEGGITGVDAAREINGFVDVPIIYVTANMDDMTKKMAMETSPAGYLKKPVNFFELITLIGRIMNPAGTVNSL